MTTKIKRIFNISIPKTILVNFHYFRLNEAIRFPILISRKSKLRSLKGIVRINGPIKTGMFLFGFDTLGIVDYRHDRAIWENDGILELNGNAVFGAATKMIIMGGGKLIVNQNVNITGLSRLIVSKEINIGTNCLISWDVQIMDTDFHKIFDKNDEIMNLPKPILIEDNVWIGCKSLILKGTIIPQNSIIAANSCICSKLKEENAIYGGYPTKILKTGISWKS